MALHVLQTRRTRFRPIHLLLQVAGNLSSPTGLLESLIRHLGGMDMFTVTTNEDAELRQYRHMLQLLSGFCAAAAGQGEGLRRVSPAETLAAASAASQVLRYFLKPNATGGQHDTVPTTSPCLLANLFLGVLS